MNDGVHMRWLMMVMPITLMACDDSRLGQHTKQLRNEETVTVLEGLPHPMFERTVYARELKRPDVRRIMDYPFYEGGLKVSEDDDKRLRELLGDTDSYKKWAGEKACGGFHPDYAVGVSTGWTLLCFGCGEAWHEGEHIHERYDVPGMDAIQDVFKQYRDKRPEPKLE